MKSWTFVRGRTPFEIRQAYKTALEAYSEDSIVIYSLFSEAERKEILARIEEALATLINEKARSAYDQMLIQQGAMKEGSQYGSARKKLAAVGSNGSTDTASQSEGGKTPGRGESGGQRNPLPGAS